MPHEISLYRGLNRECERIWEFVQAGKNSIYAVTDSVDLQWLLHSNSQRLLTFSCEQLSNQEFDQSRSDVIMNRVAIA